MTADITRTWAGLAEAERERKLAYSCAKALSAMAPDARDRHFAVMRQRIGDGATDAKLAEWREVLRSEGAPA